MSVIVCRSPAATIHMKPEIWHKNPRDSQLASKISKKSEYERMDIWSMIQSSSTKTATPLYVHPLMRRSRSLMSQKSLEMCTESLGSETGSDDFSLFSGSSSDDDNYHSTSNKMELKEDLVEEVAAGNGCRRELPAVNYHCSASSRQSSPRSFPPPLPSISRRDGPCLHMRPHRRDGRLVVEAVPVASVNYLHARRQDGRLLLSFIDTTFYNPNKKEIERDGEMPLLPLDPNQESIYQIEEEEEEEVEVEMEMEMEMEEEEEEEEEVEVVDRGTVVEVKVSTQPQLQSGALKVHRSSLVINKFVGGTPLTNQNRWIEVPPPSPPPLPTAEATAAGPTRRLVATTTTAAAAAVAASSMTADSEMAVNHRPLSPENKLLFTSKRRNREELLHHMRRCSELRRPLFFWEPCCIATSS